MKRHICVNQSNTQELGVPAEIITKLYNLVKRTENGEEVWDAMDEANIAKSLKGSIKLKGFTYEEYVKKINEYFIDTLNISSEGYYILFEDELTKNTLFRTIGWADEGITAEQAADINLSVSGKAIRGTSISRFNEFKYFTSNGGLYDLFSGCVSLKEITMPPIVASWARTYWDHSPFHNCQSLVKVNWNNCIITGGERGYKYHGLFAKCSSLKWYDGILPPGCDEISESMFRQSGIDKIIAPEGVELIKSLNNAPKCTYVELPSTLTEISAYEWGRNMGSKDGGTGQIVMTCKATTPPTLTYVDGYHDVDTTIYVPDESVSAYQTAWSAFPRLASINGLSQLPQTYKDMGTIN